MKKRPEAVNLMLLCALRQGARKEVMRSVENDGYWLVTAGL